jgi:hypothetical protein
VKRPASELLDVSRWPSFAAGLRLEHSGADLWNAFVRAYAQAQLAGIPEIQMDYFTRATESLLLQGVNFDDQALKLDESCRARGRGVGVRQRATICRSTRGLTGTTMRPILIIPIPKIREEHLVEARRLSECDAKRGAVELDETGAVIDDLEDRRERWRRWCGLSKIIRMRSVDPSALGERKMGAPATLDTCENLIQMLLRRRQFSLPDRARNYRKLLLEFGHPATLPAAKAYPQVISALMWEACWRGMSTALQVASPPLQSSYCTENERTPFNIMLHVGDLRQHPERRHNDQERVSPSEQEVAASSAHRCSRLK